MQYTAPPKRKRARGIGERHTVSPVRAVRERENEKMGLETVNTTAPRRPFRRWVADVRRGTATTPGHLRMLSVVIAVVAIALMLVGSGALFTALTTVNTIQQRTVPDVVGMQHVHAWLADADRNAASAFLAGDAENTVSQLQFDTESAATNLDLLGRINPDDPQFRYAADIAAASRELQRATDQAGVSAEATLRLQAIAQSIGYYTSLVSTAGALEGTDVAGGTVYLQAATNLMHGKGGILDQVDTLRTLYTGDLNGANLELQVTAGMLFVYVGAALLLLLLLLKTQHFVTKRFRRRRNGRLLAATLLLFVVSGGGLLGSWTAAQSIRSGENESYIRLVNLWTARSLLYDANTNESLSLIAVGKGAQFDQDFHRETVQLVDRPLTNRMVQDARSGQVDFNGLIADELRSAATGDERDAALQALGAYQRFLEADASVRAQADAALRAQAAAAARAQAQRNAKPASTPAPASPPPAPPATATTTRPSVSDQTLIAAVDELDWYLGASMQVLERQFDSTMTYAQVTLAVTAGLEGLAIIIVALTFWGVQPRIDEYR